MVRARVLHATGRRPGKNVRGLVRGLKVEAPSAQFHVQVNIYSLG